LVPNAEKVVLYGFITGTKSEKLNFYSSNILNSLLVPILNPKITTFSAFGTKYKDFKKSKKIKFKKKLFSGICTGPNTLFLAPKNF
jgi:hypothetical protein